MEIREAEQRRELMGLTALNGNEVPIGTGFMRDDIDRGEGGFLNGLNKGNGKSPVDVNDPVALQKYLDGKSDSSQTETNTNGNNEDSFFGKIGDWIKDSTVGKFVSDWVIDPVVNAAKEVGSFAKEWIVDPVKSTYNDAKQWLADSALGRFTSKAIDIVSRAIDLGKKTWDDFGKQNPLMREMIEKDGKVLWNNVKPGVKWFEVDPSKMFPDHKSEKEIDKGWPSEGDIKDEEDKTFYLYGETKF